jgi:hypothetical protein
MLGDSHAPNQVRRRIISGDEDPVPETPRVVVTLQFPCEANDDRVHSGICPSEPTRFVADVAARQFKFWNSRNSYISVFKRPNCMPPKTCKDYDYQPRALEPPPMPPEVFIHYLQHGEGDLNPYATTG